MIQLFIVRFDVNININIDDDDDDNDNNNNNNNDHSITTIIVRFVRDPQTNATTLLGIEILRYYGEGSGEESRYHHNK